MKSISEDQIKSSTDITAFRELVTIIVDYYCFKNNIVDEDETEGDDWKKGTKYEESQIIPTDVNSLIEQAFEAQLRKFI